MDIIIPVAGAGTRLRPYTYTKPKALMNVAGKPILSHILDKLQGLNINKIIFIIGFLGEQIKDYVKNNYDFDCEFVEQKELKGQAHAISLAKPFVKNDLLIVFADTIFETDLTQLNELEADGAVFVKEVEDARRFGIIILENDFIKQFIEKSESPPSNLAIIGLYYIKNSELLFSCIEEIIRKDIRTRGEYYLADALQLMVDKKQRFIAPIVNVWVDCGTPEALIETNRYLLSKLNNPLINAQNNNIIIPPVFISNNAKIENSIIGPYVSIMDGAIIRKSKLKNAIIGSNSVVENADIEEGIVGDNCKVSGKHKKLNIGADSVVS